MISQYLLINGLDNGHLSSKSYGLGLDYRESRLFDVKKYGHDQKS